MPGTSYAKKPNKNEGPNIEKSEVISENSDHRYRKTVINGNVHISKFHKDTGAVDITVAGPTETVTVTGSGGDI